MDFFIGASPHKELKENTMNSQIKPDQINAAGHLTIGGVDSLELAQNFGTPLVVYDVEKIRKQIRAFKQVFEEENVEYSVMKYRYVKL